MKRSEKTNKPTQKLITVVLVGLLNVLTPTILLFEGIAAAQNRPATLVPPLPLATDQVTMGVRAQEMSVRSISAKAPVALLQTLTEGKSQDVIVVFDDHEVRRQAAILEKGKNQPSKGQNVLDFQAERFATMKRTIKMALPRGEVSVRRDYLHLPLMTLRVRTPAALDALLKRGEVVRVYRNEKRYLSLAESLALIHQPNIPSVETAGTGTTVAVLDTGVDFTNPAFGSCSAPGVPAECKIIAAQDIAPDDGSLDDDGHGTNVAGIVLGVAPGARVAALDVFRQSQGGLAAFDSDILAAIDWAIANQATYNIVAMNLSLGGGLSSIICEDSAYTTPFAHARAAGITPVVAAGNDGDPFQISYPACTPGAVRVGAVYDAAMGPKFCDFSTNPDQVTCFSNSASFLTVLAPGSEIVAAGITMSGTSQATPHVAGAIAVLRERNAALTPDQIEDILKNTGTSVTDFRNGLSFPRLDVLAAVEAAEGTVGGGQPSSDLFHDNMENGGNGWNPQESWGQTTSDSYSPSYSWTDSPAGNYRNNANVSLYSPTIALPSSGSISLTFQHRYDLEFLFDYANVWVTADNGATYTWLWSFTGTSQGWTPETFDLSAFQGQSIQIVFQLLTDNTVTADGWYIDDVVVTAAE